MKQEDKNIIEIMMEEIDRDVVEFCKLTGIIKKPTKKKRFRDIKKSMKAPVLKNDAPPLEVISLMALKIDTKIDNFCELANSNKTKVIRKRWLALKEEVNV